MIISTLKHFSRAFISVLLINAYLNCITSAVENNQNNSIHEKLYGTPSSDERNEILQEHRRARNDFGVFNDLTYSLSLQQQALNFTKSNAAACGMVHRGSDNLYYSNEVKEIKDAKGFTLQGVKAWASEVEHLEWYFNRFKSPTWNQNYTTDAKIDTLRYLFKHSITVEQEKKYGHLNAMVWKNAKEVGCAYAISAKKCPYESANAPPFTQFYSACVCM